MSSPSSANTFDYSDEVWPHSARWFLALGAISACTSVVFSAAFAHLPVFAGGVPTAVQTALSQQQFHSLGLLFIGLALRVCGVAHGAGLALVQLQPLRTPRVGVGRLARTGALGRGGVDIGLAGFGHGLGTGWWKSKSASLS
jgi:hypothetical protein